MSNSGEELPVCTGRREDSDGIRTWSQDHPMGTGTLQGEQPLWRYSLKQIEHWGEIPQISQRSNLQFSTSTSHWLMIPKGQSINHSGMDGYQKSVPCVREWKQGVGHIDSGSESISQNPGMKIQSVLCLFLNSASLKPCPPSLAEEVKAHWRVER